MGYRGRELLWMLGALLLVAWLAGMVTGTTGGTKIHLLLALACAAVGVSLLAQNDTSET
jgi:hypothetical protein